MPSPGSSIPAQEKPLAGNVLPNCSYPTRSITLPTTKQSLRFLLETADRITIPKEDRGTKPGYPPLARRCTQEYPGYFHCLGTGLGHHKSIWRRPPSLRANGET